MSDSKFIRWWRYASFWKLLAVIIGTIVLSLISSLLIPDAWCLFAILPICGVGGYFMRKFIPEVLKDLTKEMD